MAYSPISAECDSTSRPVNHTPAGMGAAGGFSGPVAHQGRAAYPGGQRASGAAGVLSGDPRSPCDTLRPPADPRSPERHPAGSALSGPAANPGSDPPGGTAERSWSTSPIRGRRREWSAVPHARPGPAGIARCETNVAAADALEAVGKSPVRQRSAPQVPELRYWLPLEAPLPYFIPERSDTDSG
jgi:hypothetical protein